MDWKNEYRNNKGKLFAIGAGALVLALIAFSGLCWSLQGLCSDYIAGIRFTYWEIVGISSVSFVGLLLIRPIGKHWLSSRSDASYSDAQGIIEPAAAPPVAEESGSWRDLYAQLSQDERQAFKALMEKYCADTPASPLGEGSASES